MAERGETVHYIRVDSATGKPMAEAKHFFWCILNFVPECYLGADVVHLRGEMRINFRIQKYHRDKFYNRKKNPDILGSELVKSNLPYCETTEDGELLAPGDRLIDASDFLDQFKKEEVDE